MNRKFISLICAAALTGVLMCGCAAGEPSAQGDGTQSASPTPTLLPTPAVPIEDTSEAPDDEPTPEELIPEELEVLYVPGTYTGEGDGHDGLISVEVTVDESSMLSVTVTENNESNGSAAIEVIPAAIMARQTTDVDAVAGATVTSDAIVDAVANALELAMG